MSQISFGRFVGEARRRRGLTQEEVAGVLGMSAVNYGDMERGKRKEVLDPERSIRLCRLLNIDMLDFVVAMGYPVRMPGVSAEDVEFLKALHELTPDQQRVLRAAVGLGSPTGRQ